MNANTQLRAGFAALEMVIVVVVLGIVFAMTLKGTALVRQMRAFVIASQIKEFQNRISLYLDQYSELPGDDKGAPGRWNRPVAVFLVNGVGVSVSGDRRIQGLLSDYGNASGEQFFAWRDLRSARLIEGDVALVGQSAMPENPFGGVYGFAEDNLGLKNVLCATQIPGDAAQSIDRQLDDGNVNTGVVRGTSRWDPVEAMNHFREPDKTPYDPEKLYIICAPQLV